jgi:putative ABC transport system permease protein
LDGRRLDDRNAPDALFNQVTPSYFDTMGIPIVRGRSFTSQETRDSFNFDGAPIVVSEGTARQFWPRQDPIGKRLTFGAGASSTRWEGEEYPHSVSSTVVGIAKDVRSADLREVDDTCLYLPITDAWGGAIVLRTRGDPKTVVTAVRRELSAIDSNLEAVIEDSQTAFTNQTAFVVSRLGAIGSAIIGILGLLMASVGIYGTVGFAVTQRTHEIGVRMVLGARPRSVLGLVLAETMRPVAIGLAAGLAGAAMVSRALSSLLFDLSPLDPEVYLGVSVFLMGVALLAGYVPAHRATKVDPMVALRYE